MYYMPCREKAFAMLLKRTRFGYFVAALLTFVQLALCTYFWHTQIHNQPIRSPVHCPYMLRSPVTWPNLGKVIITFLVHFGDITGLYGLAIRHFGSTTFCRNMNHSLTKLARRGTKARQKGTIRYKYWVHKNIASLYTNRA